MSTLLIRKKFIQSAIVACTAVCVGAPAVLAQTAAQHNVPGGPKDKVEKFVGQYGLALPPPPDQTPIVSTTTVTSLGVYFTGPRYYVFFLIVATGVHTIYNTYLLRGFLFG